ncbi:hypothetical protein [Paremcibacter congregatus]|uniref:hypothetical protein n=1 Tax=Paremcibacter congregatus TaxID=2043170 RepID=UPI0030EBDA37|tara:strand:- start:14752 stop:15078 length:327 start_codon:yes stop_codon:yes gene_type:complete
MNKNLDSQLKHYSKVNFKDDLANLERDVKHQLFSSGPNRNSLQNFMKEWFGMPISISASAVASLMILGIMLGGQLQTDTHLTSADKLGLEVFSVSNEKLPSSLLAVKL